MQMKINKWRGYLQLQRKKIHNVPGCLEKEHQKTLKAAAFEAHSSQSEHPLVRWDVTGRSKAQPAEMESETLQPWPDRETEKRIERDNRSNEDATAGKRLQQQLKQLQQNSKKQLLINKIKDYPCIFLIFFSSWCFKTHIYTFTVYMHTVKDIWKWGIAYWFFLSLLVLAIILWQCCTVCNTIMPKKVFIWKRSKNGVWVCERVKTTHKLPSLCLPH